MVGGALPVVGGALPMVGGALSVEAGIPGGPSTRKRVLQLGRPHAATLSSLWTPGGSPDLLKGPSKGQELLTSRWG